MTVRFAITLAALLSSAVFAWQMSKHAPRVYDDTADYVQYAARFKQGDWQVVREDNRSPGYPAFLAISDSFGIKPNVAAAALNPLGAALAVATLSGAAVPFVAAAYLVWVSTQTQMTYALSEMTESIMPFMLMVTWILGSLARAQWMRRRFEIWLLISVVQFGWVSTLKPAFKGYALAMAIWAAFFLLTDKSLKKSCRRLRPWLAMGGLVVTMLAVNHIVYPSAGVIGRTQNKSLMLMIQVLPKLTAREVAELSPKNAETYRILNDSGCRKVNSGHCPITYEQGAELYDALTSVKHLPIFLHQNARKVLGTLRYGLWNQDVAFHRLLVGLPDPSGFGGLLLAILVTAAVLIFSVKSKPIPFKSSFIEQELLTSLFYSVAVYLCFASTDLGRLCLTWIIPLFVFSVTRLSSLGARYFR